MILVLTVFVLKIYIYCTNGKCFQVEIVVLDTERRIGVHESDLEKKIQLLSVRSPRMDRGNALID